MKPPETIASPAITEICSVTEQCKRNGWSGALFDFNKAKIAGVDYFNCGVVERNDGVWLIARRSKWEKREDFGYNDIMAFLLDDVRLIVGHKVHMGQQFAHEHFEDPRAVLVNGRMFISCCNFIRHKVNGRDSMTWPHQIISEVDDNWKVIKRYDPIYGNNGRDSGSNKGHCKNWNWFWHNNHPHLLYMAVPHQIAPFDNDFKAMGVFDPKLATSHAQMGCGPMMAGMLPCWETKWDSSVWKFGLIRGGTPPVLVGNEYITFFHSSTKWSEDKRQYHMGAYAFENKPPFRITKITLAPLLSGSRYDRWYPSKPPCIFPCGALLRKGEWFITYGVNDIECGWAKIPHDDLIDRWHVL